MMIWPKPETLASRKTVANNVSLRAIDPLDEGYSERVTKSTRRLPY
jgi:hypothetical protein